MRTVEIISVDAEGERFLNLTPGSRHEEVESPISKGFSHSLTFVMGNGEPVPLMKHEFFWTEESADVPSEVIVLKKSEVVKVQGTKRKSKWDLESIMIHASGFKSTSEWNAKGYGSYSAAKKLGIFDEVKKEIF